MVGSDIGDINSPTNVGSRSTRVDPKLFGKPSDFSGDRREWRHFEWVFRNWFGFLYDTAEEWLDQAASAPGELGEAVADHRETDKALYMRLAMVCKSEALDVVKTVTRKRVFESWRKLSKEYGATTGTSLHEYTHLLEYDFGTTDGLKKKLLKWENQIVDFQKTTGEAFSDRLKCAIVLSRSAAPIRTYLRVQNRGDYGALRVAWRLRPRMMVTAQYRGSRSDEGQERRRRQEGLRQRKVWQMFRKVRQKQRVSKNNDCGKGNEKGKKSKGKQKKRTRKRREASAKFEFPGLLQVMWQMGAQGE